MIVDLNHEAVDSIIKSILLQDYKALLQDVARLEKSKKLADHQALDLAHNKEYLAAFEKLMEYYVGFDWKKQQSGKF